MASPCTMGNGKASHDLPRFVLRKQREAFPPVNTHAVSPEMAMFPLEAANPASPGICGGTCSQSTARHVVPPSRVTSKVKHPLTGSPKTKPSLGFHQAMASKKAVSLVSWCTHSGAVLKSVQRPIHPGEAMEATNHVLPFQPEARNEGKVLSGAIHCCWFQWAPASVVSPTQPCAAANRICCSERTSNVRMALGAVQCRQVGSGVVQLTNALQTAMATIKWRGAVRPRCERNDMVRGEFVGPLGAFCEA